MCVCVWGGGGSGWGNGGGINMQCKSISSNCQPTFIVLSFTSYHYLSIINYFRLGLDASLQSCKTSAGRGTGLLVMCVMLLYVSHIQTMPVE